MGIEPTADALPASPRVGPRGAPLAVGEEAVSPARTTVYRRRAVRNGAACGVSNMLDFGRRQG